MGLASPELAHFLEYVRTMKTKVDAKPTQWHFDSIAILIILICNPVSLCFECDMQYYPPDSVLYAYLADEFRAGNWSMVLYGVNHIDSGVLLPPLFPALMAMFEPFVDDLYLAAPMISKLSALLTLVVSYLLLKTMSNRLVAVVCVILIPLGAQYYQAVFSPLTESLFMLMLIILCFSVSKYFLKLHITTKKRTLFYGLLIGCICTFTYYTRQIGFFTYIFITLFVITSILLNRDHVKKLLSLWLYVVIGSVVSLTPYIIAIWSETGQLPIKQHLRQKHYVVTTNDSEVVKLKNQRVESKKTDRFERMLERRRDGRRLTPDGREMLGRVILTKSATQLQKQASATSTALVNLNKFLSRFKRDLSRNTIALIKSFGLVNFTLFCLSSLLPFIYRSTQLQRELRLIVPIIVPTYIICLSIFGGSGIERYALILIPLMTIQLASECFQAWRQITNKIKIRLKPLLATLLLAVFSCAHVAAQPFLFTNIELQPNTVMLHKIFKEMRSKIEGEPVFAISPYFSWLAGGKHRVMPNDSLEKILQYAKHTQTRWLLVDQRPNAASNHYYRFVEDWYKPGNIDQDYPGKLRLCSKAMLPNGEGFYLFEILGINK